MARRRTLIRHGGASLRFLAAPLQLSNSVPRPFTPEMQGWYVHRYGDSPLMGCFFYEHIITRTFKRDVKMARRRRRILQICGHFSQNFEPLCSSCRWHSAFETDLNPGGGGAIFSLNLSLPLDVITSVVHELLSLRSSFSPFDNAEELLASYAILEILNSAL